MRTIALQGSADLEEHDASSQLEAPLADLFPEACEP
jgi:hypothetical protein